MQRFLLLIACLCCTSALFSQTSTTYDFLRNDVSARAAALGGSFQTATDDPNDVFFNPAGLATLSSRKVSVGFFKHLLDINAGYASFGSEVPNLGYVGAGIIYYNYGEFQRTGEEGQNLGTFGASDLALSVAYGSSMENGLHYGIGAKFIYSSIAEVHSSAVALDAGIQYAAVPNRVTLGASLLNIGTQLSPYMNTRENVPLDLNVGASLYPEHLPAVIFIGFHKLNEQYDSFGQRLKQFSLGAEFTASENLFLRLGYSNERRQELKIGSGAGLAGFSIGGGISTGSYLVDYAFSSLGSIGALHRVSVTF
jgi:hypothetical protein